MYAEAIAKLNSMTPENKLAEIKKLEDDFIDNMLQGHGIDVSSFKRDQKERYLFRLLGMLLEKVTSCSGFFSSIDSECQICKDINACKQEVKKIVSTDPVAVQTPKNKDVKGIQMEPVEEKIVEEKKTEKKEEKKSVTVALSPTPAAFDGEIQNPFDKNGNAVSIGRWCIFEVFHKHAYERNVVISELKDLIQKQYKKLTNEDENFPIKGNYIQDLLATGGLRYSLNKEIISCSKLKPLPAKKPANPYDKSDKVCWAIWEGFMKVAWNVKDGAKISDIVDAVNESYHSLGAKDNLKVIDNDGRKCLEQNGYSFVKVKNLIILVID